MVEYKAAAAVAEIVVVGAVEVLETDVAGYKSAAAAVVVAIAVVEVVEVSGIDAAEYKTVAAAMDEGTDVAHEIS